MSITPVPTGTAAQTFCNSATVAELVASGTGIQWYAAATGGAPLASTTPLVNGTTYYASQTVSGCESATRFAVTVTVDNPPAPTSTTPINYTFGSTATKLSATPLASHTLNWYTSAIGGTPLATAPTPSTATVGQTSYWVSQVSANGCESIRQEIVVNISKANITGITFRSGTFTYDGNQQSIFINGTLPAGATVTYTNNAQTNAGVYTVTANINGGPNYNNLTLTATLTILKANITGITFPDGTFTDNGTPHSLFINGTLPTGATVSYANNAQTNAGICTVTASINGGTNYNSFTLTATLTILKADFTGLTLPDVTYTYDSTPKSLTVSGTLPTGVTVTYQNSPQTNAGIYAVTAIIDGGNNYNNLTLTGTLTILKAPQTITWNQELTMGCDSRQSILLTAISSSGMPVTYTSSDTFVVVVYGNTAEMITPGNVIITASQPGNNNYLPAPDLQLTQTAKMQGMTKLKWNDVVVFDNSSGKYVKWQWYKNGTAVDSATDQFYNEGQPLSGTFHVVATDTNGKEFVTCPLVVVPGNVKQGIVVYPNPVQAGEIITLIANYQRAEL